jgi:CelD/BcsL family acetyltransferase involved in cellulose biosynthesis
MEVDSVAVTRFADTIFTGYNKVSAISFHAIRTTIAELPFPHQRFNFSEDFVVELPGTAAEYLASLGPSTRSYIKRYLNRARRVFPSFLYHMVENEEVSEQLVHDIIHMNQARMQCKGKIPGIDDDETGRLFRLARLRGLTGVVTIDGRPCAGVITYRSGLNYFMEVVAHDPAYDDYRLGTLCCYLTVCECIARGGREFHFLWGRNDYKNRLGGVQRDLDDLVIYRSPAQQRRNCGLVLRTSFHGRLRQAKLWLRKNDPHHRPVLEAIVRKVWTLKP